MEKLINIAKKAKWGIATAVFGLTAGYAFASIPDGSGVIHACYQKNTGTVRIIDSATTSCNSSLENPISWSQTGPTGATGATGPQGPAGDNEPDAYVTFVENVFDASKSKNVTDTKPADALSNWSCIDLSIEPRIVVNNGGTALLGGSQLGSDMLQQYCGSGWDAIVTSDAENYSIYWD